MENPFFKNENLSINVIEYLLKLLKIAKSKIMVGNKVKISFVKDRPGHDFRYALNSNKIKKRLNWNSKIKFEKGLYETFLWYYKNQSYYDSFDKKDIIRRLGLKND